MTLVVKTDVKKPSVFAVLVLIITTTTVTLFLYDPGSNCRTISLCTNPAATTHTQNTPFWVIHAHMHCSSSSCPIGERSGVRPRVDPYGTRRLFLFLSSKIRGKNRVNFRPRVAHFCPWRDPGRDPGQEPGRRGSRRTAGSDAFWRLFSNPAGAEHPALRPWVKSWGQVLGPRPWLRPWLRRITF